MKKFQKIFAIILAMVMVVAMATGCSKSKSASKNGGSGDGVSVKMSIKGEIEGEAMDFTIGAQGTDKAASISFNGTANFEGMNVKINADQIAVVAGDKVYVNVKSLMDTAKNISEEMDNSTVNAVLDMIDSDWVYLKIDGISSSTKIDDSLVNDMIASIKDGFSDIAESKDGSYSITIENEEDFAKFVADLKNIISKNASNIVDYIVNSSKAIDVEKVIDGLVDEVADALAKQMGMDKDTIKSMLKSQMGELDASSYEITKEQAEALVDQLIESLDTDMDDFDFGDGKIKLTVNTTDTSCEVKAEVTAEGGAFEISYSVDTKANVSVSEPKNAKNVMDIVGDIMSKMN